MELIVLRKYLVVWKIQPAVTTDGVIGVHGCFKFITEN